MDHAELLIHTMRKTWPDRENYRRGRIAVWDWIKRLDK